MQTIRIHNAGDFNKFDSVARIESKIFTPRIKNLYRNSSGKYHLEATNYHQTGLGSCGANIQHAAYYLPIDSKTEIKTHWSKICKKCIKKIDL